MNIALAALLAGSIVLIECLIGGTRLVFSLPAYAILGIAAVITAFRAPSRETRPRFACLLVTVLFFAYILVRAVFSPVDYLAWQDYYMVLACLAAYFLTAFYLKDARSRKVVLVTLLVLAVVEVIIGIRQFKGADNWMPFGLIRADSGRRASGMLISSIHLAGLLEVIGVIALSFACWSSWKIWARVVTGYIGALCYLGVAITGSRGGYLSTVGSLFVFAVLSLYAVRKARPKKFRRALAVTAAFLTLGIGGAILLMSQSPTLQARLRGIPGQLEPHGLDIRISNWLATIDQFKVSPVFGTGAGTHLYYGRLFRRPNLQSDPIHAHNDYLELLAEYGIVGGIGMFAFLLVHLLGGVRGLRWILERELGNLDPWEPARSDGLAIHIGALSAIAAYLVHSISDFNLHVPGHALIFAFIFGILATPPWPTPDRPPVTRIVMLFRWILPALGAWLFAAFVQKMPAEYWAEKARIAVRDLDFTNGVEFARKALETEQRDPHAYFYLGGALRMLGVTSESVAAQRQYLERAVEVYHQGLALYPHDEHMLVRLGQTLGALGRFQEAEAAYLKAIELDPNFGRLHAFYARHLAVVGRAKEAEERLKTARSLAPYESFEPILRGSPFDPKSQIE